MAKVAKGVEMMRALTTVVSTFALAIAAQTVSAADIPLKAPAHKSPAPMFNWTGFYAGATAGYGWGESRHCEGACTFDFDINGFVGGGTIGLNWQSGAWIAGIEADISFADIGGSTTGLGSPFACGANPRCLTEVHWFGTARLRAGPALGAVFPYLTGGFAFGELHASIGIPPLLALSETKTGWTAGAGVEYAFAPNWSTKLEYLYVDLGSFDYSPTFSARDGRFSVLRVGLNYRYGTY